MCPVGAGFAPGHSPAAPSACAVSASSLQPARGWFLFAIGSLVFAGLLSRLLVVGRLPFLGGLFTDPLFFKRALVVHVDLAIVVWFQAGTLAFLGLALGPRLHRGVTAAALALAAAGVGGLLVGALMPGAQPVLSNYVPVIDHRAPLRSRPLARDRARDGGLEHVATHFEPAAPRQTWSGAVTARPARVPDAGGQPGLSIRALTAPVDATRSA